MINKSQLSALQEIPFNKKGFIFAIVAIVYEIIICAIYGYLFGYDP